MGSEVLNESLGVVESNGFDLAGLLHGIFLSYVQVTADLIPLSRFKRVTEYMSDTLYKVSGVPILNLIEVHDVEATLDRYTAFLESVGIAKKATVYWEDGVYRFNLRECVFGGDCRRLVSGRYICPFALFAGFLAKESNGGKVLIEGSERTMLGSRTLIRVGGKDQGTQKMKVNV
ncbi:MAG: hypothetical protein NWE89_03470 [Candidatus Bathyarchaeota archaeon]|nr:hypothetical protein [Candidatus Bathyarchaeota archaeon]